MDFGNVLDAVGSPGRGLALPGRVPGLFKKNMFLLAFNSGGPVPGSPGTFFVFYHSGQHPKAPTATTKVTRHGSRVAQERGPPAESIPPTTAALPIEEQVCQGHLRPSSPTRPPRSSRPQQVVVKQCIGLGPAANSLRSGRAASPRALVPPHAAITVAAPRTSQPPRRAAGGPGYVRNKRLRQIDFLTATERRN